MEMVFLNSLSIIGVRSRDKVVTERTTHLIASNHNVVIIYNSLKVITTLYLCLINRNFDNYPILMLTE